jgi:nucleotide-binding universal stress UspA family protein
MIARPHIVCAVDASPSAARAVRATACLASALEASVVVTHVFDPLSVSVPPSKAVTLAATTDAELVEEARAHAQESLAIVAGSLVGIDHSRVFAEGEPVAGLLQVIDDYDARLIVTAPSVPSRVDLLLGGSITAEVVVKSPCPVVAVAEDAALDEPGPVLAAYDGSDHSLRAARHGAALAARMRRDLVLLHVTESGQGPVRASKALGRDLFEAAGRALSGLAEERALNLDVSMAHDEGDPVGVITRIGRERQAALIVAGTRGMNAAATALLGSVSAGLVRSAGRPVVLASPAAAD